MRSCKDSRRSWRQLRSFMTSIRYLVERPNRLSGQMTTVLPARAYASSCSQWGLWPERVFKQKFHVKDEGYYRATPSSITSGLILLVICIPFPYPTACIVPDYRKG